MVAELYIRDVVRNCAEPMCFSQDHVRRHKEELGLRVHELAYEPGAGDAVHLNAFPGDPFHAKLLRYTPCYSFAQVKLPCPPSFVPNLFPQNGQNMISGPYSTAQPAPADEPGVVWSAKYQVSAFERKKPSRSARRKLGQEQPTAGLGSFWPFSIAVAPSL